MKQLILSLFILVLYSVKTIAFNANVQISTFRSSESNYVELEYFFWGKSLSFTPLNPQDSFFVVGKIEVTVLFKQFDNIVKFDKYILTSPGFRGPHNFSDLRRYTLENGEYDIQIDMKDALNPKNAESYKGKINIEYNESRIGISDIMLLSDFKKDTANSPIAKSGYIMASLPGDFCSSDLNKMGIYFEIYNTFGNLKDDFILSYGIKKLITTDSTKVVFSKMQKKSPDKITPFLTWVDVSQLESGNYVAYAQVLDKNKKVFKEKYRLFQRSNPDYVREIPQYDSLDFENSFAKQLDDKEVTYSLRAIAPLIEFKDVDLLNAMIKSKDLRAKQLYLYDHWMSANPKNPELGYKKYMEIARKVDDSYRSGFGYGFETDRGVIYLKYGPPNDKVAVNDEPDAPPYEIWRYNQLERYKQTNVKFIFYNPSLAHNMFLLLHSTARGERQNLQWQTELYKSSPNSAIGNRVDGTDVQDGWNRRAKQRFDDL